MVRANKHVAEILCENGSKLTTTQTRNLEFGVEVEIFIELDTMKVTKIQRLNPDRELLEEKEVKKIIEEDNTGDASDQDYYDRVGWSPTNQRSVGHFDQQHQRPKSGHKLRR